MANDDIPLPPGSSPFRCKGIMYLDTLRYFDEHARDGRAGLFACVKDKLLRGFLTQSFVVSGWYDVLPMIGLHRAGVLATGRPYLELVRDVTRWQMPQQLRGIYKFVLKLTSPDMIMRNLARATNTYYDFARVDIQQIRPKTYETSSSGVPAPLAPAYMASTEVGVKMILEVTGVSDARQRWLKMEPEGSRDGVETVRVRREITWT
jgi:hypothetical protein